MQNDVNWTTVKAHRGPGERPKTATQTKTGGSYKSRRGTKAKTRKSARLGRAFSRPFIPSGILVLIGVFIVMLTILFLHSWTVSLNEDVRSLQDDLNRINSEIDSKNGRLISNADLKTIEDKARALGMTEAQPSQYVYESSAQRQTNVADKPAGLYDFIRFFTQVREEKLWPGRQ